MRLTRDPQVAHADPLGTESRRGDIGKRADHLDSGAGAGGGHCRNQRAPTERLGEPARTQLLSRARQPRQSVEDEVLEGLTGGDEIDGQDASPARATGP